MAKEITEKPAKFCFPDCPYTQLEIVNNMSFADDKVVLVSNVATCVHETACQMWFERRVATSCTGCIYNGETSCTNATACRKLENGVHAEYTPKWWKEN